MCIRDSGKVVAAVERIGRAVREPARHIGGDPAVVQPVDQYEVAEGVLHVVPVGKSLQPAKAGGGAQLLGVPVAGGIVCEIDHRVGVVLGLRYRAALIAAALGGDRRHGEVVPARAVCLDVGGEVIGGAGDAGHRPDGGEAVLRTGGRLARPVVPQHDRVALGVRHRAPAGLPGAVSYTHLDVYKRQIYGWSI